MDTCIPNNPRISFSKQKNYGSNEGKECNNIYEPSIKFENITKTRIQNISYKNGKNTEENVNLKY